MKSLSHIKAIYAQEKHFKSWEHFCLVANDELFIRAIDDIAQLYADSQSNTVSLLPKKIYLNPPSSKRNKRSRNPFTVGFSK
jgi:hypothetical protein